MSNSTVSLAAVFIILAPGLNLVAAVCVIRSRVYGVSQIVLQSFLIWMLPLFGATLVLIVWAHDHEASSRDHIRDAEGPWLPGLGPESDRSHHDGGFGEDATHGVHDSDSASAEH